MDLEDYFGTYVSRYSNQSSPSEAKIFSIQYTGSDFYWHFYNIQIDENSMLENLFSSIDPSQFRISENEWSIRSTITIIINDNNTDNTTIKLTKCYISDCVENLVVNTGGIMYIDKRIINSDPMKINSIDFTDIYNSNNI